MTTNFKKKVIHIIRSTSFGGLELYVETLINQLSTKEVDQYVYCVKDSVFEKKIKQNHKIKIFNAYSSKKISIKDILELRQIVNIESIDVVHVHTNTDLWLGSPACFGKNSVTLLFSLYMNVIAKKDFVHKLLYSRIDKLISTSEFVNKEVAHKYPIYPQKIELQRYGRSIEDYQVNNAKRTEIRNLWLAEEPKIVVGTMCRFDPSKGVRELIESYILLSKESQKKIEFWIVGERTIDYTSADGTIVYEKESDQLYRNMIQFIESHQLKNKIKIIPFQKDLQGYLSAMDVFVLASYNEMYALAVLDALLMKLPVIGINTGGTPEQLAQGRGVVVESKSSSAIANAIEVMKDRLEPNEAGHNWVKKEHDWKNVLPQFLVRYNNKGSLIAQ